MFNVRRLVPWLLLGSIVLARGKPVAASAATDRREGVWHSSAGSEPLVLVTALTNGGVSFTCAGRFLAYGVPSASGFMALARIPDFDGAGAYRYQVLHVERVGPTKLRASFSGTIGDAGAVPEDWEFGHNPKLTVVGDSKPSQDPDRPKLGDVIYVEELPEAQEKTAPSYPEAARKRGIQGTVMVQALVGRDGLVHDTRVVASIPGLDEAAVAAVVQRRFEPARAKGKPIAVWVAIPVKFSLH